MCYFSVILTCNFFRFITTDIMKNGKTLEKHDSQKKNRQETVSKRPVGASCQNFRLGSQETNNRQSKHQVMIIFSRANKMIMSRRCYVLHRFNTFPPISCGKFLIFLPLSTSFFPLFTVDLLSPTSYSIFEIINTKIFNDCLQY